MRSLPTARLLAPGLLLIGLAACARPPASPHPADRARADALTQALYVQTDSVRAARGLDRLRRSSLLGRLAREHSASVYGNRARGLAAPTPDSLIARAEAAGMDCATLGGALGEPISLGFSTSAYSGFSFTDADSTAYVQHWATADRLARQAVESWLHRLYRDRLLAPEATLIGHGAAFGMTDRVTMTLVLC